MNTIYLFTWWIESISDLSKYIEELYVDSSFLINRENQMEMTISQILLQPSQNLGIHFLHQRLILWL